MKFLFIALIATWGLVVHATTEHCEEQSYVLTGADKQSVAQMATQYQVPVETYRSVAQQFTVDVRFVNDRPEFRLKTPLPVQPTPTEVAQLNTIFNKLQMSTDGIGVKKVAATFYLLRSRGGATNGQWSVDYTCIETDGEAAMHQGERSSNAEKDSSPRLEYNVPAANGNH